MAKKPDFRENVCGFLQAALHELHQASMYAEAVAHADVRKLIVAAEKLKERLAKEMTSDQEQWREDARQKAALARARQATAIANKAAAKSKRK